MRQKKHFQTIWMMGLSDTGALLDTLGNAFSIRTRPMPRAMTTFLDTFDWRLYRKDSLLWVERTARGRQLSLNWVRPGGSTVRAPVRDLPAFSRDLETPAFHELAGIIEPRRLLETARLDRRAHAVSILDKRDKTVARLFVEHYGPVKEEDPNPPHRSLTLLRAEPVRGYPQDFQLLIDFLTGTPNFQVVDSRRLIEEVAPSGRAPGSYSSSIQVLLQPAMTAGEAARTIYEALLERILVNEEGTRLALDPEFLHDFRVAVRRTRAGLTQIRGVFENPHLKRFKKDFKWLGSITGTKRDLDVHLLRIGSETDQLPDCLRQDYRSVRQLLDTRACEAQEKLVEELQSERYRNLVRDWGSFLGASDAWAGPNAGRPVLDIARERIWPAYEKVFERGSSLQRGSPAAEFHGLRIDCKKLRYLLEFFRSLFDQEPVSALVSSLKVLQDNLGALNDFEVQTVTLQELGCELYEKGLGGARSVMAVGVLIDQATRGRLLELDRFEKQFGVFSSSKNSRLFRRLFQPEEAGRVSP